MPTHDRTSRRAVLASVGAAAIAGTTSARNGRGDRGPGNGRGPDRDEVEVRIVNCYRATVFSEDPDVAFLTSGIYFRETDHYSFHDEQIESFPHHLNLRRFDWARERDAVLVNVAVAHDIATETLASATAPSACQAD